jgi:hypothetical protein
LYLVHESINADDGLAAAERTIRDRSLGIVSEAAEANEL